MVDLIDVHVNEPHVSAHNDERHAINDLNAKVANIFPNLNDWVSGTTYAPRDFVWAYGARAECTVANSDATFDPTKWKFHGTPIQQVEIDPVAARKAFSTPAMVPIITGTFTALSATVYTDERIQATIGGIANGSAFLYICPVSAGRNPHINYQDENVATFGGRVSSIGTAAPSPKNVRIAGRLLGSGPTTISHKTKLTNLTPGTQYKFEVCMAVIGEFDLAGPSYAGGVALTGATDVVATRSIEQAYPPASVDANLVHGERGSWVACVVCTDGIRLVRFPGLGLVFTPYVWKTVLTAALGGATPYAVDVTPDGTKFVVIGQNGASSKLTVINVSDGSVAYGPYTIPFVPRTVKCATNNTAFVVMDLGGTSGLFIIQYTLSTGATSAGNSVSSGTAPSTVPGCHVLPSWNMTFQVVCVGNKAYVFNVSGSPTLVYTITHSETIQVAEVNATSTKLWVAGASGQISQYPLATTSTPDWTFQVVDTIDRTTARARNWVKMQRFAGTTDTNLGLFSSSAGTPGSYNTTGYNFYQIDVGNTNGVSQYTQWPSVGTDGVGGSPFGGGFLTDDGTIFGTVPAKNTLDDWFGCMISIDPTYYLAYDHAEIVFSPAVA